MAILITFFGFTILTLTSFGIHISFYVALSGELRPWKKMLPDNWLASLLDDLNNVQLEKSTKSNLRFRENESVDDVNFFEKNTSAEKFTLSSKQSNKPVHFWAKWSDVLKFVTLWKKFKK
jgi:hypothetical protein